MSRKKIGHMTESLFVTGATGFVGSHFVHRHLARYEDRIAALVRGESAAVARQRLHAQLERTAASYCEPPVATALETRLEVLAGDIQLQDGGLSAEQVARLRGRVGELWHFAASLNFEQRHAEQIRALNLHATEKMLALAERLGVRRFIYVSTAYTAGARIGQVAETLHDPAGPFNNVYEETKCAAEHAVVAWGRRHAIDVRIMRPSIVVGPSTTLMTGGSDTGLYGFYRELYRARRLLREARGPVVVSGNGAATINLVPVDHVVDDMLTLREQGFVAGPIYHLTSSANVKLADQLRIVCELTKTPPMTFGERAPEERTPLEQLLERRTTFYRGYLQGDKAFARVLPPRRGPTEAELRGYLLELERELRHNRADAVLRRHTVTGLDDTRLCAHTAGEPRQPTILLVNALGMPATFFLPLAKRLAERFFVITWESRGLPNLDGDFDVARVSTDDHVKDALAVLAHFNVRTAAVVAWSTGVPTALALAERFAERVSQLVAINPVACASSLPPSPFAGALRAILPFCAESVGNAQLFCELVDGHEAPPLADSDLVAARQTLASVWAQLEPSLAHLVATPFRHGVALHRYANMLLAAGGARDDWRHVAMPALVIGGAADRVAGANAAYELAQRLADARAQVADGDHYLPYLDGDLAADIEAFVAGQARDARQVSSGT